MGKTQQYIFMLNTQYVRNMRCILTSIYLYSRIGVNTFNIYIFAKTIATNVEILCHLNEGFMWWYVLSLRSYLELKLAGNMP